MDDKELTRALINSDLRTFTFVTHAILLGMGFQILYTLREMDRENPQSDN